MSFPKGYKKDLELLFDIFNDENYQFPEWMDDLNTPIFRPGDFDLTPRTINHWNEQKVFFKRNKFGKWHYFDLVDGLWILIVKELRELNFSIKQILNLKNKITIDPSDVIAKFDQTYIKDLESIMKIKGGNPDLNKKIIESLRSEEFKKMINDEMGDNILKYIILDIGISRTPYRLLVNKEGEFTIHKDTYEDILNDIKYHRDLVNSTHISIPLNKLLSQLIQTTTNPDELYLKLEILSSEEKQIIDAVRQGNIEKLTIKFNENDHEPEMLMITKSNKLDKASRLTDIIANRGFQDIEIKTQGGKITTYRNTEKVKLKSKVSDKPNKDNKPSLS